MTTGQEVRSSTTLSVVADSSSAGSSAPTRRSPSWLARRAMPASAWIGLVMTALVVLVALAAPLLAPYAPDDQDLGRSLAPPFWLPGGSLESPLGADYQGRDLLSRLIFGARTSLLVGVSAVAVAGLLGAPLGLVAGYCGGWIDAALMRLADAQLALPPIVLAIGVLTMTGSSVPTIVAVLGVIGWVQYARVIRGQTLSLREREFVLAARVCGASAARIIFHHIFPNTLGPLLVIATVNVSGMILAEASLSFLGIGIRPPTAAWGTMLSEGRDVFATAWWNAVFPGLAIVWTVFGINLLGDAWQRRR
ncbi:MAG: ABC transporter permease [Chloroflexi bacterium]|nr:ABC transporter permease [Chloroflexota bacterium]